MDEVEALANAKRAYIIAPAGCGKTHLIAQAVSRAGGGRELILTHTHAGVDALRKRLKDMNTPSRSYHIDTIAGWALRYAASFPKTSELSTMTPTGDDWPSIYGAAVRLLKNSPVRDVVQSSYSGIYVDEYQDCTVQQHELVVELANLLPCRILGDPFQGIFGFGDNRLVDWKKDVPGYFDKIPDLTKPWRWKGVNDRLGAWLQSARKELTDTGELNLDNTPVNWVQLTGDMISVQTQECWKGLNYNGHNVVAIHNMQQQCHFVARLLKGKYTCVETMDCEDLLKGAEKIHVSDGTARASAVIEFASHCMTKVGTELKTMDKAFSQGRVPRVKKRKAQCDALVCVSQEKSPEKVLLALETIRQLPDARMYRKELYAEMCKSLREYESGNHDSLKDAAWYVRDRTRRRGRWLGRYVLGTTLLVKGLEFDHAIILDADALDIKNLYVAITRGSRSLTILSRDKVLKPRKD